MIFEICPERGVFIRSIALVLLTVLVSQGGCIWKLWTDDKPLEERTFDVYGTVRTITANRLVIETESGQEEEFAMVDSSIKGSDFEPGAYVHVYYKIIKDVQEVTMVVEKVDY